MRETTQKNEACFDAQRSRLHWQSKQASFAIEASFIFYPYNVSMWFNCGLTILVDHFKLYLYYELTQLLLVNQ